MKILMIDAGYNNYELNEPLGIEVLSACLLNSFPNLEIELRYALIDMPIDDIDFDILCVSANFNDGGRFKSIINYYKRKKVSFPVIIGGVLPTLAPEYVLSLFPDAICIIGEGEVSLIQLVSLYFRKNGDLSNINNIAYCDNGKICYTKRAVYDLSQANYLPNRKYLRRIIEKQGLVRMETSRGCVWNKCAFCILPHKYANAKLRSFPMGKVINEIIMLSSNNAKIIYFTDEEFLGENIKRIYQFIRLIKTYKENGQINPELSFFASTSVRCILSLQKSDNDLLQKLKGIGSVGFFIGVESFSNSQLCRYRKGTTKEDNIKVINILEKVGLIADFGVILFDPLMTMDELRENVLFIKEHKIENTYSRLLKSMRIIPYTEYCKMYFSQVDAHEKHHFNAITAEYEYHFIDPNVARIVVAVNNYLACTSKKAYKLQGIIRSRETDWESAYDQLQIIREDEFDFLFKQVFTED